MTKCQKTGKSRFNTEDEANRQLKKIGWQQARNSSKPIRAYFCILCNGFHLTKMGINVQSRPLKLESEFYKLIEKQQEDEII